jgi:hypothetical protein
VSVNEEIMFEDADTANLGKPARTGIAQTGWYGRSLGSLSLLSDKVTVKAAAKGVGVAKVTYDALAHVYALSSPSTLNGETDFSILALIKGTAS